MLGLNFPMFLASLSRSFRSKPCDDLWLAAADSLALLWGKVLQRALVNASTPSFPYFAHVSVQEQVSRPCLAGVRSVHAESLTAHGAIHKHAWVPLGNFNIPLWSSRAVVLGGWSRFLTHPDELQGLWFCCFCPWSQLLLPPVAALHTIACQNDQHSRLWFASFRGY